MRRHVPTLSEKELLERIARGEVAVDEVTFLLEHPDYIERPADIETFVSSDYYLGLSRVVRPSVMDDLKNLFCDPTRFMHCAYEEAVFDEAIGTGKSFKTSIILCYGLHHLLCLRDPQGFFGMDKSSLIAVMNMSINSVQAKKVVFGELRAKIQNSPWFRRYHLDPDLRAELRFERNIVVIPGHSGATYPLGYNLIMAVMDEAAFFTQNENNDVAEDMFYALKRRIQTRFSRRGGLLIMISSPRYTDDFIERKIKEAKQAPTRIFARRRAIWEVLPEDQEAIQVGDYFDLNGNQIPTRYRDDFMKNPEKAWRDLGARPSLVLEPFFRQMELIKQCVDPDLRNPVLPDGKLAPWFRGDRSFTYFLHIDLALVKDACGIAMAHREGEEVTVDLMHRFTGSHEKEIDISEVRYMVLELCARGFLLGKVTYDQFQSASSIQELRRRGISSETFSVDRTLAAYQTLKELFYRKQIRFYKHEVFLREIERLELKEGKKIDHPPKGSKDMADAVAGAVFHAVNEEEMQIVTASII